METTAYPLPIVQGLSLPAAVVREVGRRLSLFDTWPPARLPGLSQRRSETVPHAALVLRRLLVHAKPNAVLFSAHGLREGALFDLLPSEERATDPLFAACARIAPEDGVRADLADALLAWTDPLFPVETVRGRALRRAACRLVDVAWAEHPELRAEQALRRVLDAQALSVPHDERAFLALVALHRYGGARKMPGAATALTLAGEELEARARLLGLALRVAGKLTARSPALLAATGLRIEDGRLALGGAEDGPLDEAVVVRLRDLARTAGLGVAPLRYDVA
jgi:exopolyphosphatase/guanosine-5'-triphosphate,3'-diphosphate pyrophosphatase